MSSADSNRVGCRYRLQWGADLSPDRRHARLDALRACRVARRYSGRGRAARGGCVAAEDRRAEDGVRPLSTSESDRTCRCRWRSRYIWAPEAANCLGSSKCVPLISGHVYRCRSGLLLGTSQTPEKNGIQPYFALAQVHQLEVVERLICHGADMGPLNMAIGAYGGEGAAIIRSIGWSSSAARPRAPSPVSGHRCGSARWPSRSRFSWVSTCGSATRTTSGTANGSASPRSSRLRRSSIYPAIRAQGGDRGGGARDHEDWGHL